MDKKKNYYEILDLDKSATAEEIKSAFKLLAKKYHPDINKSHFALEKFREIKEAYDVLIDYELRKEYDKVVPLGKAYSGFCNYHLCKKEGFTLQCKHCGKYFCTEHIRPHEPWTGIPKWGMPENVHPCPDYNPKTSVHMPYKCRRCSRYVPIELRHPWLHDCYPEDIFVETPKPPHEDVGVKEPIKEYIHESKYFVNKIFNPSFNIHFSNKVKSQIGNIRKEILKDKKISSFEVKDILQKLMPILVESKHDSKFSSSCQKLLNSVYSIYGWNLFEYWKKLYSKTQSEPTKPTEEPTSSTEPKPIHKLSPLLKKVAIACTILILLLSLLIYASTSTIRYGEVQNVTSTKAITSKQNVSNKISFSEYTNDVYASENKQATLNGFLRRSIEGNNNAGVHVFSIVDDYDNAIVLDWSYNELKKYLPDIGTTKDVYSVKGIFKREYKTLKFKVESVSSYQREPAKQIDVTNVASYTEPITINRTKPRYPLIRNFVFKAIGKEILCEDNTKIDSCSNEKPLYCTISGLRQEPTKCGCPTGKRIYKNECINEVKCQDGTYEPECSKNKPKQCVDGKLVENPEVCGCPEFYKLKDKKCVYIKCSDGTIEPDCSPKLKMQCIEGNFIYNPNKCGCPDGYVKRGNNCVKTCNDGTAYDECSNDKPFYCDDGILINKASKCGCNYDSYPNDEECVAKVRLIELKILEYTNVERKFHGLSELRWNNKIAEIARAHSEDMANNNFFSHINLNGEDPSDRARKAGFAQVKQLGGGWYTEGLAENIGKMATGNVEGIGYVDNDPASIAKAQVQSWMDSPGHRSNILNSQYSDLGVGVAKDGIYYTSTQNFW